MNPWDSDLIIAARCFKVGEYQNAIDHTRKAIEKMPVDHPMIAQCRISIQNILAWQAIDEGVDI